MSRIDQDDGCTYLTAGESWNVTIRATVTIPISISGLSDRDLDRLGKDEVADALADYYDLPVDADDILEFEVEDQEVEE